MTKLAFAPALALLLAPALAQPPGAGDARGPRRPALSAGAALAVVSQPYAEAEEGLRAFPIPLIAYQGERFQFAGKTASVTAYAAQAGGTALTFSAVADYRFQSYEAEDSPVLVGMANREGTLELGGRARAERGRVRASLTGLADVLRRHGGYEVDARLGYELGDGRARSVVPDAGLRYQSAELTSYYFGVEPDEALNVACVRSPCPEALARPTYAPGGALAPSVGLTVRQALGRRLTLFGIARYEVLPDAVTDSPIVSADGQVFAFGGVAYAFGG